MENPRNTISGTGVTMTTSAPNQQQGLCSPLQLSTMTAGALIFISGGMHLMESLGWGEFIVQLGHFHYCWFIAVIIGTVLYLILGNILPKKFLMAASAVLVLIGGILFTSYPNSVDALVAGRYLNGIVVGLTTVSFLCYASAISSSSYRGACLGIEQFCVTLGIGIQLIYISEWNMTSDISSNRLHGILDIVFAVAVIGCLFYFTESPVDYIRRGNDAAALDSISRLQGSTGITMETHALFEDHKDYVREQENYSMAECLKRGLLPMIKMIVFRSMMLAFSLSMYHTLILQIGLVINRSVWPGTVAGCVRIAGGLLTLLIVDKLGRKIPAILWAFIIGGLMICLAVIFTNSSNLLSLHKMEVATSACLSMQFFAGSFAPITSVYMGEAFPLKIRTYLMAVCVIIEQLIQIIVMTSWSESYSSSGLMVEGIMILIAAACFCVLMPETKKISLNEAQNCFVKLFNFKMF